MSSLALCLSHPAALAPHRRVSACTTHAASRMLLMSPREKHRWMGGMSLPSVENGLLPCLGQSQRSLSFLQCKQGGELALQSPG